LQQSQYGEQSQPQLHPPEQLLHEAASSFQSLEAADPLFGTGGCEGASEDRTLLAGVTTGPAL
jgi:hypothetical protein